MDQATRTPARSQEVDEDPPAADLSPAHIDRLVAQLPPALHAEMSDAAEEARTLAWRCEHLMRRFHAVDTALEVEVGGDPVDGDLVNAVEQRTDMKVVLDVIAGVRAMASELVPTAWPDDEDIRRCMAHARTGPPKRPDSAGSASTSTTRIARPERIPPIVATTAPRLLAEALELAERARGLVYDINQVETTLALLSHDPGLGIETSTHDPVAERLTALMEETGMSAVSAVVYNTSLMLNDEGEAETLYDLCRRLGVQEPETSLIADEPIDEHIARLEARSARVDEKMASVGEKIDEVGDRVSDLLAAEQQLDWLRSLVRFVVLQMVEGLDDADAATGVRWLLAGTEDEADQHLADLIRTTVRAGVASGVR